jgi:hypothetical protein
MGFKSPRPPEQAPQQPRAVGEARARGEADAKIARIKMGRRVSRDSLIIDPAVPTPIGEGVNTTT